jgi:hypothetical protein
MSEAVWVTAARPYGLDEEVVWGMSLVGDRFVSFVAWVKPRPLFAAVLAGGAH